MQRIECVANFSAANDLVIIAKLNRRDLIGRWQKLIKWDAGKAINRTVVTFVVPPNNPPPEFMSARVQHGHRYQ